MVKSQKEERHDQFGKMNFGQLIKVFLGAIKNNDVKMVRRLLSENHTLTFVGGPRSPLWLAAVLGHSKIVEILIKSGADVKEKRYFGVHGAHKWRTLLHLMSNVANPCQTSHLKVGKILIRHGACVNAYDHEKLTPLIHAINKGNTKWAEFLLKNGAKVEEPLSSGYSLATRIFKKPSYTCGRKEMLQLLFKYGLDPSFKNCRGENLLQEFLSLMMIYDQKDAVEISKILINAGVLVDESNNTGYSSLLHAISLKNIELVSFLIEKGADVNREQKKFGLFPLLVASQYDNLDLVDMLLSKGAKINAINDIGWTALHGACLNNRDKIISFLINKDAVISAKNYNDETPFSFLKLYQKGYDACVLIMVKEFSKLIFKNFSISETDMDLIQANPTAKLYFDECMLELEQMAKTHFYGCLSY